MADFEPGAQDARMAAAAALLGGKRLVDCTQMITPETFTFASCFFQGVKFSSEAIFDTRGTGVPSGSFKQKFSMACDVGTHIDSPGHWFKDKRCIECLTLPELVGEGVIVDVSAECAADRDYRLTLEDLRGWEERHGPVPRQAIVCMKTGWGRRFHEGPASYLGVDGYEEGDEIPMDGMHFPGFSFEAAAWLVEERDVKGIGIDTGSLDQGQDGSYPVHVKVLGSDRFQIENMNLEELPDGPCTLVCMPLFVQGAPESETRVMAVLN